MAIDIEFLKGYLKEVFDKELFEKHIKNDTNYARLYELYCYCQQQSQQTDFEQWDGLKRYAKDKLEQDIGEY